MWTLAFLSFAAAADGDLLKQVEQQRAHVDQLAAEVDAARQAARAELLALEARQRDLQGEVAQLRIKNEALAAAVATEREAMNTLGTARRADDEAVQAALMRARALLEQTVPHDLERRRARLDDAARALAAFGAPVAAPLLWQHLDAEQTLANSVERGRTVVVLDGKRIMADTMHIGSVLLFFKTGGGTVGMAVKQDASWGWQRVDAPEQRVQIASLFDASRHGAVRGLFQLPIGTIAPSSSPIAGGQP